MGKEWAGPWGNSGLLYREIMANTGKYDLQPSTFRLVISIIEVICLNISFLHFIRLSAKLSQFKV